MSLINNIVLSALSRVLREFQRGVLSPESTQRALLERFVQNGRETLFGRDHHFGQINNYADFVRNVPIRTYDDFVPYIEKSVIHNEEKREIMKNNKKLVNNFFAI